MEDLIIVAGIVVAIWWLKKPGNAAGLINTLTPALPVPTATAIGSTLGISGASSVSGGYQTLPSGFVQGIGAPATQSAFPSYISPAPVVPPPPPFYGGTVGGVGSGGNPLGGTLRAGVSNGTGTTAVRTGLSAAEVAARATGATRRGVPGAITVLGNVVRA